MIKFKFLFLTIAFFHVIILMIIILGMKMAPNFFIGSSELMAMIMVGAVVFRPMMTVL